VELGKRWMLGQGTLFRASRLKAFMKRKSCYLVELLGVGESPSRSAR